MKAAAVTTYNFVIYFIQYQKWFLCLLTIFQVVLRSFFSVRKAKLQISSFSAWSKSGAKFSKLWVALIAIISYAGVRKLSIPLRRTEITFKSQVQQDEG